MSTQPENSEAPAPAAEDLVKRLKAAANDVVLLREIVESSDSASIAAAFAMLLKDVGFLIVLLAQTTLGRISKHLLGT